MKRELMQTRRHNGEEYKFYYISPSYKGEKGILGVEIDPYIEVETPSNWCGYPNTVTLESRIHYDEQGEFDGSIRVPVCHERRENKSLLKRLTKQILSLEKRLGIEGQVRTVFD